MTHIPPKPLQPSARPAILGIPNPTCPTVLEAKGVLGKTHDLQRAIRKLRRSTQRCCTCPERAECPTMRTFARAMNAAIGEVRREWGWDDE